MTTKQTPIVRQLLWWEKEELRSHLLRLNRTDRRRRFAGFIGDSGVERYVDSLPWGSTRYMALGALIDGTLRGAAECRLVGPHHTPEAELAFSVEHDFQRRGIGSELFRRMVSMTRNRGIRRIRIVTEPDNKGMHALARRHGMRLRAGLEVRGQMELEGPTPRSVADEWFNETAAWFLEGLDFVLSRSRQQQRDERI